MSTYPWAVSTQPCVNRMTDACENITFPQLLLRGKRVKTLYDNGSAFNIQTRNEVFAAYLFTHFSILLQSLRYICNIDLKVVNNSKIRIRTASTFIRNLNVFVRPWNKKYSWYVYCMRLSRIKQNSTELQLSQCTHWQAATASEHLLG